MQRYLFVPEGEAFGLKIVDLPTPPLKPGQVRVRVRAASLNYRDLIALRNLAGRKVDGMIPLSDGAGEVVEIGEGVTRFDVGQKVAGCFFQGWVDGPFRMDYHKADLGGTLDGMLAEEAILDEQGLVKIPDALSFEEASCLPCAGLTAWTALTSRGELKPGETVLVLGTGGVSIFALQFATTLGAKVIVTSSSDEKLERVRSMGAAHTINYKTNSNWDAEVWRLTEKNGVDHVIEVGGPGTLEKSINSLKAGGQIALIGVLTGFGPTTASLFPLMARNARLDGIYVGPRVDFESMISHLVETGTKPIIDRVFGFEQASEAFGYMESGQHFGKIVITI